MTWLPHITVAAVVHKNDKFLLVKERAPEGGLVINQPAGHLEADETLQEAVTREALEETRWRIEPEAILSFNLYTSPVNNVTYFRCNFLATPINEIVDAKLDPDICDVLWLSREDIHARQTMLRSPMVNSAIDDFYSGTRYPLSLIQQYFPGQ